MANRRGDLAKQSATQTIIDAFGDGYITTADKKIYVNVKDGPSGEMIQLAISMTMPKTALTADDIAEPSPNGSPAPWETKATKLAEPDARKVSELLDNLKKDGYIK